MKSFILKIHTLLLFVFMCAEILNAQDKQKIKARKAIDQQRYDIALKISEKNIKKIPKDAEWWYLKCKSEFLMSELPAYNKAKFNYFKDAMKSATKARKFDVNNEYYEEFLPILSELSTKNNKEALSSFGQKRYAKAIQLYRLSYELNGDTVAYSMLGQSYWAENDKIAALPVLKEVTQWTFNAFNDSLHFNTFTREPFEILCDHYIEKGELDSALNIAKMGLALFPKNIALLANLSDMLIFRLREETKGMIGPDFYSVVLQALEYFPDDLFWRQQENAYYLYKMRKLIYAEAYGEADTMANTFLGIKKRMVKDGISLSGDEFLTSDTINFYNALLDYFLKTNDRPGINFAFRNWYIKTRKAPAFVPEMYNGLLKDIPSSLARRLVVSLFEDAERLKVKNVNQYRLKYYRNTKKNPGKLYDLLLLIELAEKVKRAYPREAGIQNDILLFYKSSIDSAISLRSFDIARNQYRTLKEFAPNYAELSSIDFRLSFNDFFQNYYETRIGYQVADGKKIPQTGWNGKAKDCEYGFIPDSTFQKVFKRVNYFRRTAGIKEPFVIAQDRMTKCQEAAVMIDQKGLFTHVPTAETHQCYTEGAAEASAFGQMIKEGNPAQCVTILMDDRKTETLINRRAILNPTGRFAGFGSTHDYSVFWLLDDMGQPDSSWYTTHAVAWPPEGYAPVYPQFEKWSFSLMAPLKGAKVKVKYNGEAEVELATECFHDSALLLQTLVFSPKFNLKNGDLVNVMVQIPGRKDYLYSVRFFEIPKPENN